MPDRPLFDPAVLPIEAPPVDLAPLPAEVMTADALRRRFAIADTLQWVPEQLEPQGRESSLHASLRPAAVLVSLVTRPEELTVLLTQRAAHLTDHAGQISFPGGRCDPEDRDVVATALREAWEEIGLAARHVELLGCMPEYITGTGYAVTPVVALVHPPFDVKPAEREVAECFEVPLAFLMNPLHHQIRLYQPQSPPPTSRQEASPLFSRRDGIASSFALPRTMTDPLAAAGAYVAAPTARRFFSMPYPRVDGHGEHFIWGATAGMLRNLYHFLSAQCN
ncbi:NUDIX hydrolase [Robbsia andropogonis]|uniref:NUDIX hydrolase n=1 Tax=Robbsia andropogonis TaxID=28092 RepID=UPI000466454B|nr:CoA pyrophosphatase [Robbsia andropogonis]MCP1120032.1 CoA pyrophosphatase [Robbsia andropogonis]MCP1129909.1 CoA pyrophosphatase [Robbsia andropogonis]